MWGMWGKQAEGQKPITESEYNAAHRKPHAAQITKPDTAFSDVRL